MHKRLHSLEIIDITILFPILKWYRVGDRRKMRMRERERGREGRVRARDSEGEETERVRKRGGERARERAWEKGERHRKKRDREKERQTVYIARSCPHPTDTRCDFCRTLRPLCCSLPGSLWGWGGLVVKRLRVQAEPCRCDLAEKFANRTRVNTDC